MPKCSKCGYVYSYFVQRQCPRCHLCAMANVPVVKTDERAKHPKGWVASQPHSGSTALKAAVENRWTEILGAQPAHKDLNQGYFGICGMAAALHVLLLKNAQRASELAAATFWDLWHDHVNMGGQNGLERFHTAHCGDHHIDLPYLLRRHGQMWKNHPAEQGVRLKREHFTDFCVSRALGYLLKVTRPDRYHQEKCDFNRFFGDEDGHEMGRKHVTREGTLALRTDTVAFIVRDLLGANVAEIAYNAQLRRTPHHWLDGVTRNYKNDAKALVEEISDQLSWDKFVIASIDADYLDRPAPSRPLPGIPYNHWVVIEACHRSGPDKNQLTIWSWGNPFQPPDTTDKGILDSIYSVIVGDFT